MRVLAIAFCLLAFPALADDRHGHQDRQEAAALFNISSNYGSGFACRLYAAGGEDAVVTDRTELIQVTANDAVRSVILTRRAIIGSEWGCNPKAVTGDSAVLACSGEGREWETTATLARSRDTLTVSIPGEPDLTLKRCP